MRVSLVVRHRPPVAKRPVAGHTAGVTDDVPARKEELRAAIIGGPPSADARDDRALAGEAIAAHGLAQWRGAHTIAAYLSVRTEPPTDALLDGLAASGTRLLLPVIDGAGLDWAVYDGSRTMTAGPLGISEPIGPRLGADAVLEADVVVVPAFAVDRAGQPARPRARLLRPRPASTSPHRSSPCSTTRS